MPGKVAAVDRRDIARLQHPHVAGVVPVVEMPTETLELVQGIQSALDPGDGGPQAGPAHVPGGQHGQEVQADVGGRRPLCQLWFRGILEVVGRQVVGLLGHEGLEEPPCGSGDPAQGVAVRWRKVEPVGGLERPRHPLRDGGCRDPGQRKDGGERKVAGVGPEGQTQRGDADGRGQDHPVPPCLPVTARARVNLLGRAPFEQVATADVDAPESSQNGVHHRDGLMRDEDDPQSRFGEVSGQIRAHPAEVPQGGNTRVAWNETRLQVHDRHEKQRDQQQRLPVQGGTCCQDDPPGYRGGNPGGRDQTAPQVVDHLEPSERWHPVAQIKDVGKQLPVASYPTMLTRGVDVVANGEVLDHLHVARQSSARQAAFEQVMAKHEVLGEPACHRRLEGRDVVNPLARERAFVEQILIQIGHGEDIRVHAAADREDALENRCFVRGRQGSRDAWLDDCVPGPHDARLGIGDRAVRRVHHLSDQRRHRAARKARVAVQRDHITHAFGRARAYFHERRFGGAKQQRVQLAELASLALPPHPDALPRVPEAAAVEQIEPPSDMRVFCGETVDCALGVGQYLSIGRGDFGG